MKHLFVQGIFVADLAFWSNGLPAEGETLIGDNFHINPGGKGSNQAVAAKRAGVKDVSFISKIGDDTFSKMALDFYEEEGINKKYIQFDSGAPTGAAAILIDNNTAQNSIVVVPGAANNLTVEEIEAASRHFNTGDIFLTQLETPPEIAFYGLKMAKQKGLTTILNPAPANQIDDDIYPLIDFITPNEVEASQLVGFTVKTTEDAEKACDYLLDKGVKHCIVTLGENGAFYKSKTESYHAPAHKIAEVIDTSGAGDVFNGAFCAALAQEVEIKKALNFATLAASISVTRKGTAKSAPAREEILKFAD